MAHPRLSINQATIKHADLATALKTTVDAGVQSIGLWREPVNDVGLDEATRMLADSGLRFSSHCRGGFFSLPEGPDRDRAMDDNRRAIDETAALAAAGAPGSAAVPGAGGAVFFGAPLQAASASAIAAAASSLIALRRRFLRLLHGSPGPTGAPPVRTSASGCSG